MPRPLIVTRPQPDNRAWVAQLRQRGHHAIGLPLMAIGPSRSPAAQAALRAALAEGVAYRALMFVSVNAVRYFFAHPLVQAAGWQAAALPARCWSPGPGTSQALRAAGVAAALLDAPPEHAPQFESETLWAVVAAQVQPGDRVLIVRGAQAQPSLAPDAPTQASQGQGRDWLARQLAGQGAQAVFAPVYERGPPQADAPWQAQLRACCQQPALWLFSSSECVQHLQALAPPQADWRAHAALATHGRIAAQAQALGFGRVQTCRPALDDIHQAAQALTL